MTVFVSLIVFLLLVLSTPAQAAITYVGGQTGAFAGTTSAQTINFALTGGSDVTPAAGDFVIAAYCVSHNANLTWVIKTPAGADYTLLGSEMYVDDAADANFRVAYLVASSTPETQIQLSESGTGGTGSADSAGSYVIGVFRGVHATPLEQAVQQGTAANTSVVNPGGLTPTTAGTFVYVAGCGAVANGVAGGVYTSSDLTAFLSAAQADVRDSQIGGGYFEWTSGAFNPATFGAGGTDDAQNSHAWMIVPLAPAAVAGSTCRGANMLMGAGGC